MATFRFELDHRPTRNKTYNLYLMVTVGKKRTKKKTGIQLKHIDDFNPSCKGNNWIRANVLEAKALNEQLRLMLVKAQETYNELEDDGEVSSARIIKTMDKEIVSPSFLTFARERTKEIEEEGGFRNMRTKPTTDYSVAVNTIKEAILRSQYQAAKMVNREMLSLYYGIGRYISANSREGFWGTGAIKTISERLRKELPGLKGFSESSLKNMRMFYEEWSPVFESKDSLAISPIMIGEIETTLLISPKSPITIDDLELFGNLSFTHHVRILNGEKDVAKRWKYIKLALENKWDTRILQQQIKEDVADHYGVMPSNFGVTIKDSRDAIKALNMFKDEYLLDFINTEEIGIRDIQDIDERVVEKEIVHNIKKFIMTFGHDFAFVGNQYHLEVYSHDFFPDLLFFNRELNCLVVVELKTGDFKVGYLSQLMTYLRILDDKVKKPHENPSIGIVLCKTADKDFVEYVIQDYAKPMGVATYRMNSDMPEKLRDALPDIEDLKKLL